MYDKYLMSKKACKIHNILIKSNTNNQGKFTLKLNIDLDTDMKAARGRVNEMLGARWDSGLVGHIDLIDKSKVKGAINYACKYINTNSAYGFEV